MSASRTYRVSPHLFARLAERHFLEDLEEEAAVGAALTVATEGILISSELEVISGKERRVEKHLGAIGPHDAVVVTWRHRRRPKVLLVTCYPAGRRDYETATTVLRNEHVAA